MDKNTVIGLVIIGLILSVFTIFNQPSDEEIAELRKKELVENKKSEPIAEDRIIEDTPLESIDSTLS